MGLTFYSYPNCNSCLKAKKWFDEKDISYKLIHIVEETPSEDEIHSLIKLSDLPPRRFFNTSGRVYREQNMKDKLPDATLDEMVSYLASDGMLIRRPIVTDGKAVTVGFNEDTFQEVWG